MASSAADDMRQVPDLPQDWKRYDDLVIFFIDSTPCSKEASELIKVYAIDTTDASIYHVVDFPSPGDIYNRGLCHISVVAYGTKIYAVGGTGVSYRSYYQNTWICDIASTRQWYDGPRLLSGMFRPILFTLDDHLYVLESRPKESYEVPFEVLNLLADVKNMSWEALPYSLVMGMIGCEIGAIAIDEEKKRVYCHLVECRWSCRFPLRWFVYDVINNEWKDFGPDDEPINNEWKDSGLEWKDFGPDDEPMDFGPDDEPINNEWKDFGPDDEPIDLLSNNLMLTPDFHFSHIYDGKICIFEVPIEWVSKDEVLRPDSGDLVSYNLISAKNEVVKKGLKCPIDVCCEFSVYFVVHLRGGDICLVSFFPRGSFLNPKLGELIVYLIKCEEGEEEKNKQMPSEPITRKVKSRSYKMVPVPFEERYSYKGPQDAYWPRKIQQLSQLRCT